MNNNNEEKNEKEISDKAKKKKDNKTIAKMVIAILAIFAFGFISGIACFIMYCYLDMSSDDKPVIYFYPEEETALNVKLIDKERIICSYPKYEDGWNIIARPDGKLIDLDTNRNLYSLYYESNNKIDYKVEADGFIVKGTDSAKFLEEKLEILGLNEMEAEEFIIYWLPKLEANKYNYIRFASSEEINKNMQLGFSVNPDSLIRVLMTYKGLNKPIEVKEQELVTPKREGFVIVEWGGSEIK